MLRYRADLRTLAFVGIYFTLVVLGWIYWPENWWLRIGITLLVSFFSFFCAVITHNTIHAPIFKKRAWNKVFQVILRFTYGHSFSAYVPGHNFSHHQHTQMPKDRVRTQQLRFKWNFLNQLLFFFVLAPGILREENMFARKMLKERPRWFWQYALEMVLVLGVKFTLLILDPVKAIFLLFIPHVYAAWGIVGVNFWQHDGCDEHHPYNHSRNFTNPILNFFCFNNGFHGAHHEKPNLHWSLLPEYHEKHIVPNIHPNLNQKWLITFLWKSCVWPGKRVDYLGNPVILPPLEPSEDWIKGLSRMKQDYNYGVES
jgi:fatty acid desaturase